MERLRKTLRVIPAGTWPDSRAEQRRYWLSRSPDERVRAGRALMRKAYWRLHGRELPRALDKTIRPLRRP